MSKMSEESLQNTSSGKAVGRQVFQCDGGNDACPALNVLEEGDVLLGRAGKRRSFANQRQGAETDEEAGRNNSDDSSEATENDPSGTNEIRGVFGLFPALTKAKDADPPMVPKCKVLGWRTGDDLKQLVKNVMAEKAT